MGKATWLAGGVMLVLLALLWWTDRANTSLTEKIEQQAGQLVGYQVSVKALAGAAEDQQLTIDEMRAKAAATDLLLLDVERQKQRTQSVLSSTQQQLNEALKDHACTDTDLPADALVSLRTGPGGAHGGDQDGGGARASPVGADSAD